MTSKSAFLFNIKMFLKISYKLWRPWIFSRSSHIWKRLSSFLRYPSFSSATANLSFLLAEVKQVEINCKKKIIYNIRYYQVPSTFIYCSAGMLRGCQTWIINEGDWNRIEASKCGAKKILKKNSEGRRIKRTTNWTGHEIRQGRFLHTVLECTGEGSNTRGRPRLEYIFKSQDSRVTCRAVSDRREMCKPILGQRLINQRKRY